MSRHSPEGYVSRAWMGNDHSEFLIQPSCLLRESALVNSRSRNQRHERTTRLKEYLRRIRSQTLTIDDAVLTINSIYRGFCARTSESVCSWVDGSLVPLEFIQQHNENACNKLHDLLQRMGQDNQEAFQAPRLNLPKPGSASGTVALYNAAARECLERFLARNSCLLANFLNF